MTKLNEINNEMECKQKEVKRLSNIIEAESKILLLMIEEAKKRGVTN